MLIDSPETLTKLFRTLDQRLKEMLEVYVIGGANLLAQRVSTRPTNDVDIIAPPNLSEDVRRFIGEIGKEYRLLLKWMNTGPARDERFLAVGWKERCSLFFEGNNLSVWMLGRKDILGLKLAAALDRQIPDRQDILSMNPTEEEWEFGRLWAREYDANVDWPAAIDRLVEELRNEQRK